MLAYRHSFHAGNHADVLKHLVQVAVLDYFNEKEKPYWVIDTHAGAGIYSLQSTHARVKGEYLQGIGRIYGRTDAPLLVTRYLEMVRKYNNGELVNYPGSPVLSSALLRSGDRLRLFELHPTDFSLLSEQYANDRGATVRQTDGFAGLKSLLPPLTRRALILIDPPYELKQDYQHVYDAIKDSLKRFAQGTYVVWYPMLMRPEWRRLLERLRKLEVNWLNVSLTVAEPDQEGFGMIGSGLFLINPPWTLADKLAQCLPYLQSALSQSSAARFTLDAHEARTKSA